MQFPCLQNLAATDVDQVVPWEFDARPWPTDNANAYKTWRKQPTTEHLFFSGFIGQAPTIRVSEQNPPREVVALVADYDAAISDEELERGITRAEKYYSPALAHRTPLSGGVRLIWRLERPLLLPSYDVAKRFLKYAAKMLHLKALLPGFDEQAGENPNLYYDVGHTWCEVADAQIPWVEAAGWLVKVSDKAKWTGDVIPIEILAAEVADRFPGRWQGDFVEGARGVRFWDPTADNPTAAIVRPTGMQCFTGLEPFVPWSQIFGRGFVERVSAREMGKVLEDLFYDGTDYWRKGDEGAWVPMSEREMARHLKVRLGLSAEKIEGRTHSEVEEALQVIGEKARIVGVAPFVYLPQGVLEFQGERVLNISNVRVCTPAEDSGEFGEFFPWIGTFLQELFDPWEQLEFMLAWLKRFYTSARDGKLVQGQAVFVAGDTGRGKTFFSNRIVGGLMGGHADASQFLLGRTSFNKNLFHRGLWTVDDATPGDNAGDHKTFSSMIKRVTANNQFEYHAKFKDSAMVSWFGRVIVTGNLDADSLRILPDLDTSILDKLLLFKTGARVSHFPDRHELEMTVTRELPHLAAWLLAWEPPAHVLDPDPRYGVARYHHPFLRQSAGDSSDVSTVRELLQKHIEETGKDLEDTSVGLLQRLLIDETTRMILGGVGNRARWMAIQLGKLEARGDGFVKMVGYNPQRNKVWRIKK
jgi:hypothetical protein